MSREKVFNEIKKYTKEEILLGLEKVLFSPDMLLRELPLVHYNRMCDEADKLHKQASEALKNTNLKAKELFDKSDRIWKQANSFIDNHHAKYEGE